MIVTVFTLNDIKYMCAMQNFLNHLGQVGVNKNLMISFNKGGVFTFWRKNLLKESN